MKQEIRIFRRQLYLDDPYFDDDNLIDDLYCGSKSKRQTDDLMRLIDGHKVRFTNGGIYGYTQDEFVLKVYRSWTEELLGEK